MLASRKYAIHIQNRCIRPMALKSSGRKVAAADADYGRSIAMVTPNFRYTPCLHHGKYALAVSITIRRQQPVRHPRVHVKLDLMVLPLSTFLFCRRSASMPAAIASSFPTCTMSSQNTREVEERGWARNTRLRQLEYCVRIIRVYYADQVPRCDEVIR
jgi:hypothetical protein